MSSSNEQKVEIMRLAAAALQAARRFAEVRMTATQREQAAEAFDEGGGWTLIVQFTKDGLQVEFAMLDEGGPCIPKGAGIMTLNAAVEQLALGAQPSDPKMH